MIIHEFDKVGETSPPEYGPGIRVRVVEDLGGAGGLAIVDSAETPTGSRRLVLRERVGRVAGATFARMQGAWFKLVAVVPDRGSLTRQVAHFQPEKPDGRILEFVTAGGERVTAGGEEVVA